MQKYLTLLFNMRFIFGLVILNTLLFGIQNNIQIQKLIYSTVTEKDATKLYEQAKFLSRDASNNTKVRELYRQACNLEHAESCYMSAIFTGYTNPENPYLQKACELNHVDSCAQIGFSYFAGKKGSTQKAIPYFKMACDGGDSDSCSLLSRIYKDGFHVEKSKNQSKYYGTIAEETMLSQCNKGNGEECKNLGDIYNPDSVLTHHKSDPAYAIKLYQTGCELGDKGSCGALGDLYYDGKYASADDETVLNLYEISCGYMSITNDHRCVRAGKIAYLQKDYRKTVKYFEQYCTPFSLDTECSFILGNMYLKGEGVDPNINKAKNFLKQSCDIGKIIQDKTSKDVMYGCHAYEELISNQSFGYPVK